MSTRLSSLLTSWRIALGLLGLYVVWGSTYLAIRIAVNPVDGLPPFLMASARFLIAGGGLYAVLRACGTPAPTRQQWSAAFLVGTLLLVVGNGLVCWGEQFVPSGVAALLIASTPVWMVLAPWLFGKTAAPPLAVWLGIACGLLGVGVLISGQFGNVSGEPRHLLAEPKRILGLLAMLVAALSWASGSLWSRTLPRPPLALMGAAAQMIGGGMGLAVVGLLVGEGRQSGDLHVSRQVWMAVGYLVLIGSIVGFGLYTWLLRVGTPATVATYAFVNPVVAVMLGWCFDNEALNRTTVMAAVLVVVGVMLIVLGGQGSKTPERIER